MRKRSGLYPRAGVDAAAAGVVSQAGGVLLLETVRAGGLDVALTAGMAGWRKPTAVHDPAKIVLDLAVSLALGGDCLADVAVLRAEPGRLRPGRLRPDGEPAGGRPRRRRSPRPRGDQRHPGRGPRPGLDAGGRARSECRHHRGPPADRRRGRHAGRRAQRLSYFVGFTLPDHAPDLVARIPDTAWTPAYDSSGQIRPGVWVAEFTGLLDLSGWPSGMR